VRSGTQASGLLTTFAVPLAAIAHDESDVALTAIRAPCLEYNRHSHLNRSHHASICRAVMRAEGRSFA